MRAKTLLSILFLLAIGVAGLIFLKAMSLQTAAHVEAPEILVAAAALEPRTLLRAQDLTWQKLSGPALPGVILRPTEGTRRDKPLLDEETRAAVYGAVLRVAVEPGAPITNDLIVKPGERDFLRVVLTPGQRAISIPVKTGGASAGLLVPGDQVDVILTQKFSEKDERMARRSVAETVAGDLKVLAIDEAKSKTNMAEQGDFGRTVTLQVTPEQAQKINVATELGKLSLTLRPAGAVPAVAMNKEPVSQAVWAGDVSPALGSVKPPENVVADPGILVVDISGCEFPVSRVFDLADVCEPAVTVVAIGDSNDVALYRQLIQAGVTEYIFKPVTPQLLARAVTERPERVTAISRRAGKLIACVGARGGVGTTSIATGLAWHLAYRENRRVALADLDLTHGQCALALNLRPTPGWREALGNPMRVDSVFLDRVCQKAGERLAVLSCEESLRDDIEITEDAVKTSISVLLGQSHAVIADLPRIASPANRWLLDNADFRVIVADQTLQSARDATRLRAALPEDVDHRNLLVINRGGEAGRRAVPLKEMESVLGLRPNLVISYEPAVFAKAINAGQSPASGRGHFPNGIAALAATLSGREAKRRGWWRR